jgi:hypothetical protein
VGRSRTKVAQAILPVGHRRRPPMGRYRTGSSLIPPFSPRRPLPVRALPKSPGCSGLGQQTAVGASMRWPGRPSSDAPGKHAEGSRICLARNRRYRAGFPTRLPGRGTRLSGRLGAAHYGCGSDPLASGSTARSTEVPEATEDLPQGAWPLRVPVSGFRHQRSAVGPCEDGSPPFGLLGGFWEGLDPGLCKGSAATRASVLATKPGGDPTEAPRGVRQ